MEILELRNFNISEWFQQQNSHDREELVDWKTDQWKLCYLKNKEKNV